MGTRRVAGLAVATGVVGLVSVASLALFFAVGKPFGSINDWSVGILGLLSGLLAVAIMPRGDLAPVGSAAAWTAVAVVGAVIVVIGAGLVISETTGFLLAGLVQSLGFALIGFWLIALNRSLGATEDWPRRIRSLGLAAGITMAIGIIVAPGIAMGLDDMDTAPVWVWIGFAGWLGIFFLYPIWSIWLGRVTGRP